MIATHQDVRRTSVRLNASTEHLRSLAHSPLWGISSFPELCWTPTEVCQQIINGRKRCGEDVEFWCREGRKKKGVGVGWKSSMIKLGGVTRWLRISAPATERTETIPFSVGVFFRRWASGVAERDGVWSSWAILRKGSRYAEYRINCRLLAGETSVTCTGNQSCKLEIRLCPSLES